MHIKRASKNHAHIPLTNIFDYLLTHRKIAKQHSSYQSCWIKWKIAGKTQGKKRQLPMHHNSQMHVKRRPKNNAHIPLTNIFDYLLKHRKKVKQHSTYQSCWKKMKNRRKNIGKKMSSPQVSYNSNTHRQGTEKPHAHPQNRQNNRHAQTPATTTHRTKNVEFLF